MSLLFKVWDVKRESKVIVVINDDDSNSLYSNLILKASQKLQIDGSKLVLEKDGTIVDEDEAVRILQREIFILLTKNDNWVPSAGTSHHCLSTITSDSGSTTITFTDDLLMAETQENADEHHNNKTISEATWLNFSIPWDKLSKSVIEDCEKGLQNKQSFTDVVQTVVTYMREFKHYIPSKAFKVVARKLVDRYPQMFQDKDEDGVIIGDGAHTIYWKLQERNNYLNRPHKRPGNYTSPVEKSPKQIKKMLRSKAGCSNWQPMKYASLETLEDKKHSLNKAVNENFVFNEDILNLLDATYVVQRTFLNNSDPPTFDEIKQEWPVLLLKPVIFWHFEKLMSISIEDLERGFKKKTNTLLQFGLGNKLITNIEEDETQKYIQCFFVIGNFFKEDISFLIIDADKIVTKDAVQPKSNAACIIFNADADRKIFSIYLEKQKVLECNEFLEAVKVMFALYYNFNLSYPKEVSHVLEFLQRYFLKINPDQGTKSKKQSIKKILSLLTKLREIN